MLHVHRATRADVLAGALAELLREPPEDPFAPDLVAVPTRGMERWLTQTMSAVLGASPDRSDGICANVLFPTPHRLVADAVAVASGVDPETDPWLPERATWPLLDVVQENLAQPWLAPLSDYLGGADAACDDVRRERRLSIVRHLAGLFDQYAMHRPAMVDAWAQGRNAGASGEVLLDGTAWQPELWRRLRARIGIAGPSQRRTDANARLREEPALLELPRRLALFGLTRLPAGQLQILRALAAGREVHLFLLHPSPALWDAIADDGAESLPAGMRRRADHTGDRVANRLLASWGRDARETQLVLAASGSPGDRDTAHPLPDEPGSGHPLLARLQSDIRADLAPAGVPAEGAPDRRAVLADDDRSIVVHSCHGRVRQVEVLRDAILHALADDPTLEPRDVIVMCPDIETYAPLIQATFGTGERLESDDEAGRRTVDLRVRLADRSLTQTNPVLGVVSALMGLVGRRITASEVLDLADRGPVRRRFGFDDDDLTRLQDWIAQSGIRWGLDAGHRAPYRLSAVRDGTWRTGLDRLLLGVTMTEEGTRLFGDVLPLDDVDSRSIELAGRFAELVGRLQQTLDALGTAHSLTEWGEVLGRAADALTATSGRDRWQRAELQRLLDEMVGEAAAETRASGPALAPAEARAHLEARLAGRPTRANFRTGHLTICTLTPMRSVPHRVVCLLGLDDVAFPRRLRYDGDNLMLSDPHVGERDPRSEDRQLLLDALLAATDRLIVTYSGNDERTNSVRPPAVPVGELIDAIDATVRLADPAETAGRRVVIRHPLQPFDPRNFAAGALDGTAPWSFDDAALQGAQALTGDRRPARPFLDERLAPRDEPQIDLDDLVAFVGHPVRSFLRRRLEMSLFDEDDDVADALPIELDALQRWDVANRLLEALMRGTALRTAVAAEKARGTLPPGVLGDRVIDGVRQTVGAIAQEVARVRIADADRDPIDVAVTLPDGRAITGTVTGVNGELLLSASFSRVSARHRSAAWVRYLALAASHPDEPFCAATIGRGSGRDDVRTCWVAPLRDEAGPRREAAIAELTRIVDLYDRGMREPLPLFTKTSAAWAEAARRGADPREDAAQAWETQWRRNQRYEGEAEDLNHRLVFAGAPPLARLLEIGPREDESGGDWAMDETTRLGRLARRLWDGLLAAEESRSR